MLGVENSVFVGAIVSQRGVRTMLTGIVDENGRYDVTVFEIGRIGRGKRLRRVWSSARQFVDMLRLWGRIVKTRFREGAAWSSYV
jgi:hypothetical protein